MDTFDSLASCKRFFFNFDCISFGGKKFSIPLVSVRLNASMGRYDRERRWDVF